MIGILMLDTAFPRLMGDLGNPDSFDFPVLYSVIPGAVPDTIVCGDTRPWADAFIEAGKSLVQRGCSGLVTTCGFLTLIKQEVAAATGVPVISSSLELIPSLSSQGKTPGILTISAKSLTQEHLLAAGVPNGTPIQGVDEGHFATTILGNYPDLDIGRAEQEVATGAEALCLKHPDIDVIVLECTNMPPYAEAIKAATGREVVSILTAIEQLRLERH